MVTLLAVILTNWVYPFSVVTTKRQAFVRRFPMKKSGELQQALNPLQENRTLKVINLWFKNLTQSNIKSKFLCVIIHKKNTSSIF